MVPVPSADQLRAAIAGEAKAVAVSKPVRSGEGLRAVSRRSRRLLAAAGLW
jgi:hypothetical protein